ncbi:unnamed protein product [Anisakis simplex]|uniref:ANK_REP_REGION domain-containing protein n=1 Tax=Anisakis simplex TaxID=6269 RepID=A0A0M3K235_ANISI|nr:unnamed protein product [Anisakis simplex]
MTVFRLGENQKQDVDHAILTALLKGQNLSAPDQLALALAWNRVDIARSDIFVLGQDWPKAALNNAMMEALINDRVDFVRLLIENGVSMHKFLTVSRLEELYNTDRGPPNTLYYIVRDVVKIRPGYRYRIPHIGLAIEKLMGNGFKSSYTSDSFRAKYSSFRNKIKVASSENFTGLPSVPLTSDPALADTVMAALSGSRALSNHILWRSAFRRDNPLSGLNSMLPPQLKDTKDTIVDIDDDSPDLTFEEHDDDFRYPFSELFLWAVLTKRQEMALCMWQHGEEAMAKALVACRLYKSLAQEAAEDYLEVEICEELRQYADDFKKLSLELLEHCYHHDDAQTLQLLTYELSNWGNETCLSLAVMVNNKQFLAHPCCQILLADLWHGGLRMRSHSNLKVVMGLLCPLTIFLLEFKSREELMLQPQTAAEHENDINDSSSSSSSSSSESDSSSDSDYSSDEDSAQGDQDAEKRKVSSGSVQSLNLAGVLILMLIFRFLYKNLFQSRRKRGNKQNRDTNPPNSSQALSVDVETGKGPSAQQKGTSETLGSELQPTKRKRTVSMQSTHSHQFFSGARRGVSRQSSTNKTYKHEHHHRHHTDNTSLSHVPNGVCPQHTSGAAAVHRRFAKSSSGNELDSPNKNAFNTVFSLTAQALPRTVCFHFFQDTIANNKHYLKTLNINVHLSPLFPFERPIKIRRRLYEFYVAPVTTFWAWTLSFSAFICCYTYILLIRTPIEPTVLEWFIFVYMIAFGLEHVRKYLMTDQDTLLEKSKFFFTNIWNILTTIALISYFIGFWLRLNPSTAYVSASWGRVILACNSVLWSIKLLDLMSVHPRMGPYITMAGKMIQNMVYVVILLCVTMLAFGLARQSITFPNEDWHWLLLRNIFYKPYFMLYGEVYADEIDTCGDDESVLCNVTNRSLKFSAWDIHMEEQLPISQVHNGSYGWCLELKSSQCVPGYWVPPLLMTVFLLVDNILLISMLLAIFNNIFDKTDKMAKQIWLFQRYHQVMEYESTPFLPPPFTPIYHFWMIWKYLRVNRGCQPQNSSKSKTNLFDFTLKLFLNDDQVEKIHDFEEDCMEDLAREKEFKKNTSNEERIHRTADRTDQIMVRINDLTTKGSVMKSSVRELDNRLESIENRQTEILECLRQMANAIPMLIAKPTSQQGAGGSQNIARSPSVPPTITIDQDYEKQSQHEQNVPISSQQQPFDRAQSPLYSETPPEQPAATSLPSAPTVFKDQFPEPTSQLVKRRLRTLTTTACDDIIPVSPTTKERLTHFGSLISLDPKILNQMTSSPSNLAKKRSNCGSIRRPRRHDEYTSITDAISIVDILPEATSPNDEDDEETQRHFDGTSTPITTLKRAKKSFVRRQNSVLKEYEEELAERMRDATTIHRKSNDVYSTLQKQIAQTEENDGDDEELDTGSLTEPELKDLVDDEEDEINSSKEYIEFSVSKHPESESISSSVAPSRSPSLGGRKGKHQTRRTTNDPTKSSSRNAHCSLSITSPTPRSSSSNSSNGNNTARDYATPHHHDLSSFTAPHAHKNAPHHHASPSHHHHHHKSSNANNKKQSGLQHDQMVSHV